MTGTPQLLCMLGKCCHLFTRQCRICNRFEKKVATSRSSLARRHNVEILPLSSLHLSFSVLLSAIIFTFNCQDAFGLFLVFIILSLYFFVFSYQMQVPMNQCLYRDNTRRTESLKVRTVSRKLHSRGLKKSGIHR